MTAKRIIPCLDVIGGRVVKGTRFENVKEVADPVEAARRYNDEGADELVFYDITASREGRGLFAEVLKSVVAVVSVPLTAGGGVASVGDFDAVLSCGADKVSINSGALKSPCLIEEAAKRFGSRRVVLSMDVKRIGGRFCVFSRGGTADTGLDAVELARKAEALGAGELVINSIDGDGVRAGFDTELLAAVSEAVSVPVVASGGAGCAEHFLTLFQKAPRVDAGLAAGIFHEGLVKIPELKRFLASNGVCVRV